MSRDFTDDCVAKVKLLEQRVGHRASFLNLDPFGLDPHDAVSLQAAARRIAEFVGLGRYRFIVGLCGQREGVGGQIELHPSGEDVFIEVSGTLQPTSAAILAILAHEITHKYLQVHGISCGSDGNENEVLTDIASLWLGLGKLVLNGCDTKSDSVEELPEGTRTTTTSHRVGYLARREFAFGYLLISTMRGVSPSEYERGLTSSAVDALRDSRTRYQHCLKSEWRSVDANTEIWSRLRRAVHDTQSACAHVARDVALLRRSCLDRADSFLRESHAGFRALLEEFEKQTEQDQMNPCLRFLHNLELERTAAMSERECQAVATRAREWSRSLAALLRQVHEMGRPFGSLSSAMGGTITCPQDGTVLRVDAVRNSFRIRCSVCGYDWAVETAIPDSVTATAQRDSAKRRPSWLRRFLLRLPRTEQERSGR